MRRRIPIPVAIMVLAAFAVVAGGNALAYFAGGGSGTAKGEVTKLSEPTISAATAAAGGTVTLTWGAVTPPGAGTVTYYVTRDGGKPAGNCPTESAATTVLTCKDAGLSIAEHTYRVTAEWHSWTTTSAVKTAKVTVGETVKFTISGNTTTPAAGAAVNLTITAKDVNNATVTTYEGNHNLVFSGASSSPGNNAPTVSNTSGTAVAFGNVTAIKFTAGIATVSSSSNGLLRVYKAGAASITATEGSLTNPTPLALTVSAGAASKFVLAAASATPAAGAADDLTITANDQYGNLATSYTGSKSLTFSEGKTSAGGNVPTVTDTTGTAINFGSATTIEFSAGVADPSKSSAGTAVLYKAEAQTVKAAEGSTVTTSTGAAITPTPGSATKLVLTSSTATPTAGTNFNLTTTAQDTYGNTATSYTGSKNITFSGAEASPGGVFPTVVNNASVATNFGTATALTFTSGVAAVGSGKNGVTKLAKPGSISVTASDGTLSTAAGLPLTVAIGAANRVAVLEVVKSAGSLSTTCYFTCSVTTLGNSGTIKAKAAITDVSGNVVSNLGAKTVTVTVTTGGAIAGSPLSIPATGLAVSSTEFTYTAPASGSFSHTITVASSGYTPSATIMASK